MSEAEIRKAGIARARRQAPDDARRAGDRERRDAGLPQDPRRGRQQAHPRRRAPRHGCDEAVHSLIDAMYARTPYTEFQRRVRIHPTVSELLPTVLEDLKPLV